MDYVLIGGPYGPTGPGDTDSRRRIFVCQPAAGQAEAPCARQILATLARRAYRRPVTPADLDPLMDLFDMGRADGASFDAGIDMALSGVLVSPSFLFRVERAPEHGEPGSVYRISDVDLASRLSFFVWSSIPDDELLRLAEQGRLSEPSVLAAQLARMLADPKARALVDNFAGQWLHLRNVEDWTPDPERFADFDDAARHAFQRETTLFLEHIIREDRSVLELIDADYTFLNERLARYYGIEGVEGGYFRRVSLAGTQRGGIVTQGSVLMVTSYPTRHIAGAARQVGAGEPPGCTATAAAARCAGAGRHGGVLGQQPARGVGEAPRQPGVRCLPREAGPAGVRAGELRCGGRVS